MSQQEMLPKDIQYKIFHQGGVFNAQSTRKLTFFAKLFVLIRCLRKKWVLLVEDQEEGIGPSAFFSLKSNFRKKKYTLDDSELISESGFFCLANKELMDTFSDINALSVSPAYNYLQKIKNPPLNLPKNDVALWKEQATYITRFISSYEANKKRIVMQLGLTPAELYTLFYLYDGNQRVASSIYQKVYKYAYNASRGQIQAAFVTLQSRSYIEKIGFRKGAKFRITALGSSVVDDIITRYLTDF